MDGQSNRSCCCWLTELLSYLPRSCSTAPRFRFRRRRRLLRTTVTDGTPIYPSLFIYCGCPKHEIHLEQPKPPQEQFLFVLIHCGGCCCQLLLLVLAGWLDDCVLTPVAVPEKFIVMKNNDSKEREINLQGKEKFAKKRTSAKKVIYGFLFHSSLSGPPFLMQCQCQSGVHPPVLADPVYTFVVGCRLLRAVSKIKWSPFFCSCHWSARI